MSDLKQRKKLLVAECEVYRETLKLEMQAFRIYGLRTKRKVTSFNTYTPLFLTGFPLVKALFAARKTPVWKRLGTMAYLGWQAYQRFGPVIRGAFAQYSSREKTAAEEYLSKRI
jgi:hypothetical protein